MGARPLIGSSIASIQKSAAPEMLLALMDGAYTGENSSNTLPQDQTGDAVGSGNISRQQKRVQAAAAATSIYQKSFVYPSPSSSLTWSSGHPLPPNQSAPGTGMNNAASSSEIDNSIPNNPATYSSFQLPVQAQGLSPNPEDAWATNLQFSVTQLKAQKRIIQNQIEVFDLASTDTKSRNRENLSCRKQHQHQQLGDSKGKAVSSSSLLVSGSDQNQHGVVDYRDDVNTPPL
ncbi:hypothetical protein Tco_1152759 [Tanacetum coccineum]